MSPSSRFGLLALLLVGLSRPLGAQALDCSSRGQTLFVDQAMRDVYYWYREIPNVDPTTFDSPGRYLDAVVYRAFDRGFTYIVPRAANDAFYNDSQFVGMGYTRAIIGGAYYIAQVYAGSPANEAGLARGDRVLEINGRTVPDLLATGEVVSITGPDVAGTKVRFKVLNTAGVERELEVVKRTVTIPTVSYAQVYTIDRRRRVGYVHLQNFVEPSFDALDQAFKQFESAAITDLVLDVRYNGGGLLSVAQHLAGLIGGSRTRRGVLCKLVHNDKHTDRDANFSIPNPTHSLTMPRLVVIASRASASASELIINGLRPYIPVTTVGDRTYGKPAGQEPITFCDQVLVPATFVLKNADGFGDYFDGLPADCPAPDDLGHELADPAEGSLAEALYFLQNGRCSPKATSSVHALGRPSIETYRDLGWRAMRNAE
jgi:C-terminal peptidase prc